MTSTFGATAATAEHGDAAALAVVGRHYAQIAAAARAGGGKVVKFLGDGALLAFPETRAKDAVAALRALQARGSALWSKFDPRCSVKVKIGAGELLAGRLSQLPGARGDIFGNALNQLFKAPWADVAITSELQHLLDHGPRGRGVDNTD